eukprot:6186488-Pyramimonas_sp.AAC.1
MLSEGRPCSHFLPQIRPPLQGSCIARPLSAAMRGPEGRRPVPDAQARQPRAPPSLLLHAREHLATLVHLCVQRPSS